MTQVKGHAVGHLGVSLLPIACAYLIQSLCLKVSTSPAAPHPPRRTRIKLVFQFNPLVLRNQCQLAHVRRDMPLV